MTRRIKSVVFFTITALIGCSVAAATELATTPADNRIAIYQPCGWSWDDTHNQLETRASDIGYTETVVYWQRDAPSAPHDVDDLTVGDYTDVLACGWTQQYGAGIVALAGHGMATGFCVMYYPLGENGRAERKTDFAMLVTTYSGLDTVLTEDGWAIMANADFHRTYYKPAPNNSGEVYLGGCGMGDWANDAFHGKARCWVDYISAYRPYISTVNSDADDYWQCRAGEFGTALTMALNASDHEPSGILQLGGNGESVLKPFVSRYRPAASSIISGTTSGSVTFNCKMGPNPFCVNGTGSFSVDSQVFLNDSTYSFVIRKNGDTDGEIVVNGASAVSGNGRSLAANYSFYLCTAQFCDLNRAAGFEGAWAWQVGGVDSTVFITTVEAGTDSLRLEGFRPGASVPEPYITVPAHGRPWLYSMTVPHGLYDRYQVVEIMGGKEAERSLGFGVSQGPPENLAALRTMLPWPPPMNTPFGGTDGRASPPRPAHLVAYSSSTSLIGALQSVWDTLTVKFRWTVNTVVGGKSAASCQNAFSAQWQANLNAGWTPPRCVVVGESNEDTTSVHNIVSMQQVPDGTGDCYYGSCANPGWWVDFFNNGTGQCPLYRLPVSTSSEAQNYAWSWQKYIASYAQARRTLYLDVGDRTGYTVVPSFRVLSEQVIAPMYSAAGYAITEHLESTFPIGLYGAARDSGRAVFNRKGALEMVSRGLVTNRSQLGAKTIQVAYDSPWTNVAVPQQCVGWWLSCDEGDDQRINTGYYPALVKRFLTANPDSYAVFVAITAYTRGGYGAHQDTIAAYLMNERWGGQATDVGDVVWRAAQNLWSTHPEVQADLYRLSVSGLPVPLPGSAGFTGIDEPAQRLVAARLWRPFPNPGNVATINYSIAVSQHITLCVFNVTGRLVRTLVNQDQLPGYSTIRWDGRGDERQLVPSGMYFVRLDAGMTSVTERIILLR